MAKAEQAAFIEASRNNASSSSSPKLYKSPSEEYVEVQCHHFIVHYLNKQEYLLGSVYNSIEDLRKEAFACYEQEHFNENNAILTYFNTDKKFVLLNNVPTILEDNKAQHLYIKRVSPICYMCENPFGILKEELLLECSIENCSQQYCSACVDSVQGISRKYSFACSACRKRVSPKRNDLIDKHLIWTNMGKLYGTRSLLDLKKQIRSLSCRSVITDINIRHIHLWSRLKTFSKKFSAQILMSDEDEHLINNVKELCQKLMNISKQIEVLHQEIIASEIDIYETFEEYKNEMKYLDRLCMKIFNCIKEMSHDEHTIEIDILAKHQQYLDRQYDMNKLTNLTYEENTNSIEQILDDVNFRDLCISFYSYIFETQLPNDSSDIITNTVLQKKIANIEVRLGIMKKVFTFLREKYHALEQLTNEYFSLLIDETTPDIANSKFILLMERLRNRTEKLEINFLLPQTVRLMHEWQNDYGTEDSFKPKLIDLFKNIESDLKNLFQHDNYIYSIPYKIGAIGDGSIGKSALIKTLTNTHETDATVLCQRSTFGYLQIDISFKHPKTQKYIKLSFYDIEGAIDNDINRSIINYFDIITKADCDLYMIVFDKSFTDFNQNCFDYITKVLKRQCILVRSKADIIFKDLYKEEIGNEFDKNTYVKHRLRTILKKTHEQSLITSRDNTKSEKVFLTAAGQNNDLKDTIIGQFDLELLKEKIFKLAVEDCRIERIYKLALLISKNIINTCFRRGYVVSKDSYRLLAAGASILPFANEIPAYCGREKIRQAFGVHDRFSSTNILCQTKDSLEEYLMQYELIIPKDKISSGCFQYLISQNQNIPNEINDFKKGQSVDIQSTFYEQGKTSTSSKKLLKKHVHGSSVASLGMTATSIVVQMSDDALRLAIPTAAGALRIVSVIGIVASAVLMPIVAAWAFCNTGNRMNEHLHKLCDDFHHIFNYFIVEVCNQACEHIPALDLSSSNKKTSSDDDNWIYE